jgi:hypothetical protein
MCTVDVMWFRNAGLSSPEAKGVVCTSQVIKTFEETLSVVVQSIQPSVSSK